MVAQVVVKERNKCKTSRGHLLYSLTYILTIAFRIFPNKMKGNFHILKRQISRGLNYVISTLTHPDAFFGTSIIILECQNKRNHMGIPLHLMGTNFKICAHEM